ncbi:MAG: tetratricopeptide repeat protein [Pseudomonadota bacterium]
MCFLSVANADEPPQQVRRTLEANASANAQEVFAVQQLREAERAFEAGRYEETIRLLESVSQKDPSSKEASILRAYAYFKLNRLEMAAVSLDRLLLEEKVPDGLFLRGLVSFRREIWDLAIQHLSEACENQDAEWIFSARNLLAKAKVAKRAEEEKEAKEKILKMEGEKRARFDALVEMAKGCASKGEYEKAWGFLLDAEKTLPNQAVAEYYRGYVWFKKGDFARAGKCFERALELDKKDEWAQYMLWLSYLRSDPTKAAVARQKLRILATSSSVGKIRDLANQAILAEHARAEDVGSPKNELRFGLELGTGLDTNPLYIHESDFSLSETAIALHFAGFASYAQRFGHKLELETGIRALERAFAYGDNQAAWSEFGAWIKLQLFLHRMFEVTAVSAYSFSLYGHEPYSSFPFGELEFVFNVRSWFQIAIAGQINKRIIHNQDFKYLEALQPGGGIRLRFFGTYVKIELGYEFARVIAEPEFAKFVSETYALSQSSDGKGFGTSQGDEIGSNGGDPGVGNPESGGVQGEGKQGGEPVDGTGGSGETGEGGGGTGGNDGRAIVKRSVEVFTDYTRWGHGPFVWAKIVLPWKFALVLSARGQIWLFDSQDKVPDQDGISTVTLDQRQDFQLNVSGEILRPIAHGFWLALCYESVDNFSSHDFTELGIDRNFSRRLVTLFVRWFWPS